MKQNQEFLFTCNTLSMDGLYGAFSFAKIIRVNLLVRKKGMVWVVGLGSVEGQFMFSIL